METGRNARGVRLMVAAIIFSGVLGRNTSVTLADPPREQTCILRVGDITFEFVRIPAGRLPMGSSSGSRDERPAHEITLADEFYLGRTEVTVRQFRAFAEATGYKTDAEQIGWAYNCPLPGLHPHERGLSWRRPGFEPNDALPAVVLSHNDATAFCRWLSERTGRTCRLPTEAEWEYAARAGRRDDSAENPGNAAWYDENTSDSPHPVGTRAVNPWGLYDMQGNAWEWCLDVWRPDYQDAAPDGRPQMNDPTIPPAIWRYVLRGGGWASPKEHLRWGRRFRGIASFASPATGLRIVLDPQGRIPAGCNMNVASAAAGARPRAGGRATLSADSRTGRTTLATHGVQFEFVRIPAGEFTMGMEEGDIEKPVHRVRIGYDFEMAKTEVTVAQFRAFVDATGHMTDGEKAGTGSAWRDGQDWVAEVDVNWRDTGYPQSDEHAVSFISWYDAMAFCHWLSAETGQEIRLPSEAEWEYACRAGSTGAYAGQVNAMGWHRFNSGGRTHPVALKQPNAWGLYDMHGNVWEWCLDFFTTSYEGAPTDGSPRWDLRPATDVVSRGGSLGNPPGWLGSAVRMGSFPECSHYNNGFRLVRVLKSSETPAPSKPSASTAMSTSAQAGPETPKLVPVETGLPRPIFTETPQDMRVPNLAPVQKEPGPPFLAPLGTTNVALGKPVSASDEEPIIGGLEMITDGDKEATDGSYVELGPLLQQVTIDLQAECEIYGIRAWHYHKVPRAYFDVIVQIADDPDFTRGVRTIFNNDMDNSAGLGVGADRHYIDTCFGQLFDARGMQGRYVRLYSRGSSANDLNHYIEVEVYGKPASHDLTFVPLKIEQPRPVSTSRMVRLGDIPRLKRWEPPAQLMVPAGTRNVALGKPVSSSDDAPRMGQLEMITDGDNVLSDKTGVELGPGLQWITIDLKDSCNIYAIQVWHFAFFPVVYFDVIIQVSDDSDFIAGVHTVFNNDWDNSAGLGVGRDWHYAEDNQGRLFPALGVRGRYVRVYSSGNDMGPYTHYTEVAVYGLPGGRNVDC
jgi:formylglycine-generating enzyme required for sulfatase activity